MLVGEGDLTTGGQSSGRGLRPTARKAVCLPRWQYAGMGRVTQTGRPNVDLGQCGQLLSAVCLLCEQYVGVT